MTTPEKHPATARFLREAYDRMAERFGPTHWWPGDTPFEIAVGAILTQNTAWTNVEKAIANLKRAKLLSPRALAAADTTALEEAIRPSGYFRQKAKRLRIFAEHLLEHYGGRMDRMAKRPLGPLRGELLALHGIGPETADDILLYACHKPVFVVDAYTRRILSRHGIVPDTIGYEPLRHVFETHLEPDVQHWQEYHGLIVFTGKDYCKSHPRCEGCPLQPMLGKGAS
ncbi:MAG: endonuclease III domain-containing protein [Candidatus Hydrogenedens sp.]|nr:endonuclease III domain-containing protein [Candidatus Hydrogenedens sp.]